MSQADTTIRAAAGVTVIGLAGIAGAISYSHMTELAHLHGEIGWRAHMLPLSVDGLEIVASLVLLADKRAPRRSGRLPWVALIAGSGASFAANIAVGGSDWIGRAVSGWPAFALLMAVKLLFGLLEHPTEQSAEQRAAEAAAGPVHVPAPVRSAQTETVRETTDSPTDGDEPRTVPTTPDQHQDDRDEPLLPAARAARAILAGSGKRVTREALARQMRADGEAVSNARVSALLRALAAEPFTAHAEEGEAAA